MASLSEPHMNVKSGAGMRFIYFVSIIRPPPGDRGQFLTLDDHAHDAPCSGMEAANGRLYIGRGGYPIRGALFQHYAHAARVHASLIVSTSTNTMRCSESGG